MFDVKFVFLWTDAVLWLLVLGLIGYVVYVLRTEELARKWRKVLNNKTAVAAAAVLSVFFAAALADSVHYRRALPATDGAAVADAHRGRGRFAEPAGLYDLPIEC